MKVSTTKLVFCPSKVSTTKLVFCPSDGQMHPANMTNKDPKNVTRRCTKCGHIH